MEEKKGPAETNRRSRRCSCTSSNVAQYIRRGTTRRRKLVSLWLRNPTVTSDNTSNFHNTSGFIRSDAELLVTARDAVKGGKLYRSTKEIAIE